VITDLTRQVTVSGYITQKTRCPICTCLPETMLYTVADSFRFWVLARLFPAMPGKINRYPAEVHRSERYPGRVFNGRVDYILPIWT